MSFGASDLGELGIATSTCDANLGKKIKKWLGKYFVFKKTFIFDAFLKKNGRPVQF